MKKVILSFFLALLFPLVTAAPAHAQVQTFKVVKAVNSNTIVADIRGKNETVKLLGISTPDTAQCFGKAADDKLKSLLNEKSVILVDDKLQGNRDAEKNLIRYVYLPDSKRTFINGEMIKQGFAYSDGQKTKLLSHLNSLETYAKNHSLGLWEACPAVSQTKTYSQARVYTAPVQYVQPTTPPASTQSSSGLSNDNYYTNTAGNEVHSPAYSTDNSVPAGATAKCGDGTYSFSQSHSGTCSHHGGVAQWL